MNASQHTWFRRLLRAGLLTGCLLVFLSAPLLAAPGSARVSGRVLDPQGNPVLQAHVKLVNAAGATVAEMQTDAQGQFVFDGIDSGVYQLTAESASFVSVVQTISLATGQQQHASVQFQQLAAVQQSITVVASAPSVLTPDPAQSIVIHDQVLDANPGRPGAPISIPGLPIETASGGIKAPQYFAPGVAGDHGEPIAQFFQIGRLPLSQQPSRQRSRQWICRPQLPDPADHRSGHCGRRRLQCPRRQQLRRSRRDLCAAAAGSSLSFSSPATIAMPTSWRGGIRRRPADQRLDCRRNILRQRLSGAAGTSPAIQAERPARVQFWHATNSRCSASATTASPMFRD